MGKATAGEKSLRANTKLQKLQSKSTNVSPPPQEKKKKKLPRSFANCRSYAGSKKSYLLLSDVFDGSFESLWDLEVEFGLRYQTS